MEALFAVVCGLPTAVAALAVERRRGGCGARASLVPLGFVCTPFRETNPLITDVISQT